MTTAIILSMGMLLESVNTHLFTTRMLMKAKAQNPKFEFSQELLKQGVALSDSFNRGQLTPDKFMEETLKLLGNIQMSAAEFWGNWNNIIKTGNIKQAIQELKKFCDANKSIIYLTSDTNVIHLAKLKMELAIAGINLITSTKPAHLDQFPLYTSCDYGKNRFELIQTVIADVKSKNFNKPDITILVLGDPENIKDDALRTASKAETKSIQQWCQDNKVKLILHKNDQRLVTTLESMMNATNENIVRKKLA